MLMTWLWCSSRPSVPHGSKDPKPVPLRFVGPVWRLKYVISVLEQHRSRLALKRAPAPTVETKARQGTCDHFSEHHGLCLSFSGNTGKPWDRALGCGHNWPRAPPRRGACAYVWLTLPHAGDRVRRDGVEYDLVVRGGRVVTAAATGAAEV